MIENIGKGKQEDWEKQRDGAFEHKVVSNELSFHEYEIKSKDKSRVNINGLSKKDTKLTRTQRFGRKGGRGCKKQG